MVGQIILHTTYSLKQCLKYLFDTIPWDLYIYIYMIWVQVTLSVTLNNVTLLNKLL